MATNARMKVSKILYLLYWRAHPARATSIVIIVVNNTFILMNMVSLLYLLTEKNRVQRKNRAFYYVNLA